jgi:hypothetical protein
MPDTCFAHLILHDVLTLTTSSIWMLKESNVAVRAAFIRHRIVSYLVAHFGSTVMIITWVQ